MSKRDNKRFNDRERKSAPKRGGKNRRDYGDEYTYEPKKRSASAGTRRQSSPAAKAKSPVRGKAAGKEPRRVLGFDMNESYEEPKAVIGTDGLEVVAGRNPVVEVLSGERDVERIFIADGSEGSVSKIVALAREQGIIVDFVPKEKIDAMAPGVKHQGVVAKVSEYKYAEMDDVFAGAHGIVIPKRRAASLTQTVALSAAGAIENMPVVQVTNLARTIEELQAKGVWVGAADMDGETYYEANLTGPIAIVIGNEGKGVGRLVKEKCDFVLSIPMYGKINSLNASNAAAVLMYGIRRARTK